MRPLPLQALCVVAACALYGALSSPTPDAPGRIEALIGLLLIFACGLQRPLAAFSGAVTLDAEAPGFVRLGALALVVLAALPTAIGLAAGHGVEAVLRDLIPLLYLFLPVLLVARPVDSPALQRALLIGLVLIAALFTARHFAATGLRVATAHGINDGLLYLANSPALPFAALIGAVLASRPERMHPLARLAAAALCAAGLAALVLTLQRAALLAVGLGLLALLLVRLRARAIWLLLLPAALALAFALLGEEIMTAAGLLIEKTRTLGTNARLVELDAVADRLGEDPGSWAFGLGWGARFDSPAVGGMHVGYTHSLFSYALLKAGVLGVVLIGLYAALVLLALARGLGTHPMLSLAILPPVLASLSVYTSYKYLALGLLLTLLAETVRQTVASPYLIQRKTAVEGRSTP